MFGFNRDKNKVDTLLKEIRSDYENLIKNYRRQESLRSLFELRYHDAVEYRINLMDFLSAEKAAVLTLIERAEGGKPGNENRAAERKTQKAAPRPVSDAETPAPRVSYADKMLKEFAERIDKYPEIIIHPDAALEMQKLFGALSCIEKDYWGVIDRLLRNQIGSKRFRDTIDLEPEINRMCSAGLNGLPSGLSTYYRLLERLPRDYPEVEREEKRCLMSAAGLLKRMQMEIIKALDGNSAVPDDEKVKLIEARGYIEGMLNDFRLKDLAKLT
ncbi:MAG: hypothetical protein JEZ04_05660 [Spirochaetales bacterium]|nr:hypothetical protein [Spirochaetales bacterium]